MPPNNLLELSESESDVIGAMSAPIKTVNRHRGGHQDEYHPESQLGNRKQHREGTETNFQSAAYRIARLMYRLAG